MQTETLEVKLKTAAKFLDRWAVETTTPEPERLDVVIDATDLLAAVAGMVKIQWGYLATITGIDLGVEDGRLELLYHFCSGPAVVTLRVRIPRGNAFIPSIYEFIPSVSFYERELIEMLGITIANTPNTDRLFLPDDWPEGVYPLRKDFDINEAQTPRNRKANGNT
ncbi:MAG: NADH-quinone oxidoreductase subunit C [Anaerolineae bacterium]|nr:NADH-quinone oxidoreductase subunit C [Anaerolineae bacterium]